MHTQQIQHKPRKQACLEHSARENGKRFGITFALLRTAVLTGEHESRWPHFHGAKNEPDNKTDTKQLQADFQTGTNEG